MQAQPQHADPAPYDPAGAWAAAVELALSSSTPGTILTPDTDLAAQREPAPAPALDEPAGPALEVRGVAAKPVVSPLPIAAARAAPIIEAEPTPVTANLPVRPASAPEKALGSLVTIAPQRSVPAPSPIATAPEPSIDVAALKLRLRDTGGIGLFDKLALKRELDNLIQQLRGHHETGQASRVALLRSPYNSLVQKVLAALRVGDPDLARVVLASREAIWGILSDPVKFFAAN